MHRVVGYSLELQSDIGARKRIVDGGAVADGTLDFPRKRYVDTDTGNVRRGRARHRDLTGNSIASRITVLTNAMLLLFRLQRGNDRRAGRVRRSAGVLRQLYRTLIDIVEMLLICKWTIHGVDRRGITQRFDRGLKFAPRRLNGGEILLDIRGSGSG